MIAYVKGPLRSIEKESVVIEVGGMGLRVFTPIYEPLLRLGLGAEIQLYTHLNVREDAMLLYGFLDEESLGLFEALIGVSGVGPKYALALLTALPPARLLLAISSSDQKALSSVSGIGPKTASRIIVDLKDKIGSLASSEGVLAADLSKAAVSLPGEREAEEAVLALISLGYSRQEAETAMEKAVRAFRTQTGEEEKLPPVDRMLSLALKEM